MSPEDYRDATDGRPRCALTAGHDCERVRRFTGGYAARILRASTRTEAHDWANDHPSSPAAPPTLSDAFGHGLRGTGASVTPIKGTNTTAQGWVLSCARTAAP
jgi:hypothetical protein